METQTFGKKLRELKKRDGLSQGQLAAEIGISRNQVVRLEAGSSIPSWPTVRKLARLFKISADDFPAEEPPGEGPGEQEGPTKEMSHERDRH
jgi:putative transcriptional regulator